MSGDKVFIYKNTSIKFSRYFIHPDYENQESITKNNVFWNMNPEFKVGKRTSEIDEIILTHDIKLHRTHDKLHISGLITISTFNISSGINFEHKMITLKNIINENTGHFLGGWVVKSENVSLSKILPSNYNGIKNIEDKMKKFIFEEWD